MNFSLVVLLYVLAVMRVTRLVNYDVIMSWVHIRAGRWFGPMSWQVEFLVCPWCISMWAGLTTAWAPLLFAPALSPWAYGVVYVLLALAASMVTGMARTLAEDPDPLELEPVPDDD